MPTEEENKNSLIKKGDILREDAIKLLNEAQGLKLRFWNIFHKKPIKQLEKKLEDFTKKFFVHDAEISKFLTDIATAQNIRLPNGSTERISLNTQFEFAIYSSTLNTNRQNIANLLTDLRKLISSLRTDLNNRSALYISLISLFLVLLGIFVPIGLDSVAKFNEFNKKVELINFENGYNRETLAQHIAGLKGKEIDFGASHYYFLTDFYKNNWEVISHLPSQCSKTYFDLIISLEAANGVNDSLIKIYNDSGLLFNDAQITNTKRENDKWNAVLNTQLTRISSYFNDIDKNGCSNFQYIP